MRFVDLALSATVALGAASALRQLREQHQVRTGQRAPAHATTHALPASTGRLDRLARWVPAPPGSRIGRIACAAWSAPLTVLGAGLVAAGGQRAVWDPVLGAYVARGVRGPSGRLLAMVGVDANALGQVIVCRLERPSHELLVHEAAHVRQAERLGPTIVPLYLWFGARFGYRDNPLERAARWRARQVRTTRS